jgi:serine/threonine protein kinase
MVYEYCKGGTLEDLIYKHKLTNEKALFYFKGLIDGFKLIAEHNILHRDIKPSNVLLHNDVIKIADFGFCKSLLMSNQMSKTMVGSPIYMAPELLRGDQYSQKADVWSLGVMLYEMLFRKCPFEEETIPRLLNLIERTNLSFPSATVDKRIHELLSGMLHKDPYRRFSW